MTYLEGERLVREAKAEAHSEHGQLTIHCPDCGALVIVCIVDEINHGKLRGICRCLCGLFWEVDLAA